MKTIGDYLRKRRLELGLLAQGVAARFGVRRDTFFSWDYGKFNPRKRQWATVIKYIGCAPESIFPPFYGELLRGFRQAHGISQKKLAVLLGVHESTVYELERNCKRPSSVLFKRIKRLMAVFR